jgi:hypothetical protein
VKLSLPGSKQGLGVSFDLMASPFPQPGMITGIFMMECQGLLFPRSCDLYIAVTWTPQSLSDLHPVPLPVHPPIFQEKERKMPCGALTHYVKFPKFHGGPGTTLET